MYDEKNNMDAALKLATYVARSLPFEDMDALNKKVSQLHDDYNNSPQLNILSNIDYNRLDSFKNWVPEALASKKVVIPHLVSAMLFGDIHSLSMYDALYKAAGKKDMVLDYSKILFNPEVKKTFDEYGAAEAARAIMTAEHWLKSADAADILNENGNHSTLCNANSILHISNEFVDCNDTGC